MVTNLNALVTLLLNNYLLEVNPFKTKGYLKNRVRDGIFPGLLVPEDNRLGVLFGCYRKEGKHP